MTLDETKVEVNLPRPPSTLEKNPRYRVGTLYYTWPGLVMLFVWLLWGDFCFTLMETVIPSVLPLKLQSLKTSNGIRVARNKPSLSSEYSPQTVGPDMNRERRTELGGESSLFSTRWRHLADDSFLLCSYRSPREDYDITGSHQRHAKVPDSSAKGGMNAIKKNVADESDINVFKKALTKGVRFCMLMVEPNDQWRKTVATASRPTNT